jgi:hypothetical protein
MNIKKRGFVKTGVDVITADENIHRKLFVGETGKDDSDSAKNQTETSKEVLCCE